MAKNVIVYHWGLYLVKKFIGVLLGVISGEKNVMVSHCWPKNGKENIVLWLWYYSQPISPFSGLGLFHNIKFPLWLSWYSKLFLLHSFFYKNKVYKNAEPQIWWNLKNILDAQFDKVFQLFLCWDTEAQFPLFSKKCNFCDFKCIFFT